MSPKVSIIIRTLNEEKHLEELLEEIRAQTFTDWEVINVDSGSTDRTVQIMERYASKMIRITSQEFTYGLALNLGCESAAGEYLVMASAHVRPVNNTWLENLISPFDEPLIGMVYGRQRGVASTRVGEERDLLQTFGTTSSILIDEPFSHNGNSAVRRMLWLEQPFKESLSGLEDLEWARRIQRKGYRVYYAANAPVYHIHDESLRKIYRRYKGEANAYMKIFPGGSRFGKGGCFKRVLVESVRDLLYASRTGKSLRKLLRIPTARLAHYLGVYHGMNLYKEEARGLLQKLQYLPDSSSSVVITGSGQHSLQERKPPEINPDEVLVQVAYVGVCATDLEVARGSLEYYQSGTARYPIVPGHEFSGIVIKSGSNVSHLAKGQKVVGECAVGCGNCTACDVEEFYRCDRREEVGVINRDGAYARYLSMPSRYIHKVPGDMPLKYCALVEPLAVCLKGLRKLDLQPGRNACVVGAGPIGNLCAQMLQSRGLQVTAVDTDSRRLDLLHKYDINTLNALGPLDKYDYLVEASGNEQVLPRLIEGSRPSAKLLFLGLPYTQPVLASFSTVTGYDKVIYGSVASQRQDWEEAIRLVHIGAVSLVDHTSVVEQLADYRKAWENVEARDQLKVLLLVSEELETL